MIFAIALLPSPAAACSCDNGSVETFSPEFVVVPTNAVIRFIGDDVAPEPRDIYENGVLRTDVVNDVVRHGASFILTQSTEEPFAPGAVVEVKSNDLESSVDGVFTLQVGAEPDDAAPTWDGVYKVDNTKNLLSLSSCGPFRGHTFEWEGVEDDVWHPSELLVIAVPHEPDHAEFVGDGVSASVGLGACSDDDETLKGDFHRSYDVFIEDGSGNRTGPFEVDTRQCGCAGVPSPAGGMGLLLAAASVAAYCSRGRRIPARRPALPALPPRVLEG